jgi:thiosulfate reductase cytochrome b subunit
MNILSRLRNIGGNLGYGRQEDAHEFMRFLLLACQLAYIFSTHVSSGLHNFYPCFIWFT